MTAELELAAILFAWLLAPLALNHMLRKTPVFWLPALAMAGLGVASFLSIAPAGKGAEASWDGIGNLMMEVAGVACLLYALILILSVLAARKLPAPTPELPRAVATRVADL